MIITVTKSMFRDEFHRMNRSDNFSYDALGALFDYLDEEENVELDVIAICCEFTEYADIEEFQDNYGADDFVNMDDIKNITTVISIGDTAFIAHEF